MHEVYMNLVGFHYERVKKTGGKELSECQQDPRLP